jgi:hypothetical protein
VVGLDEWEVRHEGRWGTCFLESAKLVFFLQNELDEVLNFFWETGFGGLDWELWLGEAGLIFVGLDFSLKLCYGGLHISDLLLGHSSLCFQL